MEDKVSKELIRLFRYIILLNSVQNISIVCILEKNTLSFTLTDTLKKEEEKLEVSIVNIRQKPESIIAKELDILSKKLQVYREKYNLN